MTTKRKFCRDENCRNVVFGERQDKIGRCRSCGRKWMTLVHTDVGSWRGRVVVAADLWEQMGEEQRSRRIARFEQFASEAHAIGEKYKKVPA